LPLYSVTSPFAQWEEGIDAVGGDAAQRKRRLLRPLLLGKGAQGGEAKPTTRAPPAWKIDAVRRDLVPFQRPPWPLAATR